ncbi:MULTISPECIES: lytic transglycosylase domain-containing protein [Sphingobium]|uniref:lytic transglycosylase domain-containing protein n=1 Tax=Sphingobium sp. MI1205 TaxID=407020 RepID=UPI0007706AA2|nr:lytic transglycosylase domain-containing protein [Sphingobium sp. MI1205]AMK19626.1 putative lytic transglycosylase [Sphingobium sp. MI1205]
MASLKLVAALLAMGMALPAEAETVSSWRPFITEASSRCGIPAGWIERVMSAESNGRTTLNGRPIRSHAGAMGLMQLMPTTWDYLRRSLGLGSDPDNPRDNILAGTCYLRMMYDRFGYPGLFAAYNAGPGRYAEHLATGRPLPGETIAYLGTVGRGAPASQNAPVKPVREMLFVVRRRPAVEPGTPPPNQPPSLFVVRREGL